MKVALHIIQVETVQTVNRGRECVRIVLFLILYAVAYFLEGGYVDYGLGLTDRENVVSEFGVVSDLNPVSITGFCILNADTGVVRAVKPTSHILAETVEYIQINMHAAFQLRYVDPHKSVVLCGVGVFILLSLVGYAARIGEKLHS